MQRLAIIILIGAVTGGCTLTPETPDLAVRIGNNWQTPENTRRGEPLTEWWRSFHDPVLNALIEQAAAGNHDLQIAAARIREARAGVQVNEAVQMPQVDLRANAGRRKDELQGERFGRDFSQVDFYEAGFDASWEIDLFGGNAAAASAARSDLAAAEYAYRDVMVSLLAEVARNYITLRGARQRLEVARDNIDRQQETLNLLSARSRAGMTSELDVSKAQTELKTLQSRLPPLQAQIQRSRYRLAVLLGKPPGQLAVELDKARGLPPLPEQVPVGLPSELLERRPDIRRAQAEVLAANARVGAARADLFPRFFISGMFMRTAEDAGAIQFGPGSIYSFGPVITLPLLDGGRIRANIDIQDARLQQALAQYERTVLQALEDVEAALVDWNRDRDRQARLGEAAAAARLSEKLARDLYRQGLEDFFAVLDAQRSQFSTEDALVVSRIDTAMNLIGLYKSLGGGWPGGSADQSARVSANHSSDGRYAQ